MVNQRNHLNSIVHLFFRGAVCVIHFVLLGSCACNFQVIIIFFSSGSYFMNGVKFSLISRIYFFFWS